MSGKWRPSCLGPSVLTLVEFLQATEYVENSPSKAIFLWIYKKFNVTLECLIICDSIPPDQIQAPNLNIETALRTPSCMLQITMITPSCMFVPLKMTLGCLKVNADKLAPPSAGQANPHPMKGLFHQWLSSQNLNTTKTYMFPFETKHLITKFCMCMTAFLLVNVQKFIVIGFLYWQKNIFAKLKKKVGKVLWYQRNIGKTDSLILGKHWWHCHITQANEGQQGVHSVCCTRTNYMITFSGNYLYTWPQGPILLRTITWVYIYQKG